MTLGWNDAVYIKPWNYVRLVTCVLVPLRMHFAFVRGRPKPATDIRRAIAVLFNPILYDLLHFCT